MTQQGITGEERRFYAFADSVIGPDHENPSVRLSVQLDAVDANLFDAQGDQIFFPKVPAIDPSIGFGLIRFLTTPSRLARMGVNGLSETDWFEIVVARKKDHFWPRAWFLPAENDFIPGRALNLIRIQKLSTEAGNGIVESFIKSCTAPEAKQVNATEVIRRLDLAKQERLKIIALDVGQASCVAFSNDAGDIGYFDVGKPISFNHKTFPKGFSRAYPSKGFVLLSHWDFDHFALAIKNPALMALDWYAPDQKVGFNTSLFQRLLGKRLHFIQGDAASSGVLLNRCLGTDPRDRNSTGYVFRFERENEAVLLTGDADYLCIPNAAKDEATALTVPHHGGKGTSPPKPAPCDLPIAVASYGAGNNYKHPHEPQLVAHEAQEWVVRRTATNGWSRRSNRLLFPNR